MSKLHQNKPDGFEHSADDDCKVELSLPPFKGQPDSIPSWGEHNLHQRIKKRQADLGQPSVDELLDKFFIMRGATPDDALEELKRRNEHGEPAKELKSALLAHALSCLPEKYHFVQYREFLVADKKMPLKYNQKQAQSYVEGFNAAIDLMEQSLKAAYNG